MQYCQKIVINNNREWEQLSHCDSFVGGHPKLPNNFRIPACAYCGNEQTFFFQIAFSSRSRLADKTLALFACTSCADRAHRIPEMLTPALGAVVPISFLCRYQTMFGCLMFPTKAGQIVKTYIPRIKFAEIAFEPIDENETASKCGGRPNWLLGDESPSGCDDGSELIFALQLMEELKFPILSSAPRQVINWIDGTERPSEFEHYELFLANRVYVFVKASPEHLAYIITQID